MAPTAFWTDLHEDDSIYRSRPPRIAKVRAIEANARLLKPTQASLARAAEKKAKNGRLGDDMDKENAAPNGVRRSLRKRRLTIPQSPKFQPHPKNRALPREQQLTRTSRELREIDAIRKKVQETRRRNQKYHEATTRSVFTYVPKAATNDTGAPVATNAAQSFKMALQSSGGVGIPAVRRQRLTTPVAFTFESDKRAAARKRKSASSLPPLRAPPAKRFRW